MAITLLETIRVLLIDDESEILKMLQIMLKTKDVRIRNNINDFNEQVKWFDPHVIILDYKLGEGKTAFDALKSIKDTKRNIPIIYTGLKLPCQVQTQLHLLGVMSVIMKPLGLSTIESIIENYYEVSLRYRS